MEKKNLEAKKLKEEIARIEKERRVSSWERWKFWIGSVTVPISVDSRRPGKDRGRTQHQGQRPAFRPSAAHRFVARESDHRQSCGSRLNQKIGPGEAPALNSIISTSPRPEAEGTRPEDSEALRIGFALSIGFSKRQSYSIDFDLWRQ